MEENEIPRRNKHAEEKKSHLGVKILIILILLVIIIAISAVLWYNTALSGTGSKVDQVEFEIAMGSGTN